MSSILRKALGLAPLALLLSGCNMVVMNPAGDIALQQRNLIVISALLMFLIIIPVMCLIAFFAYKYRQSNLDAVYDPEWHHSTRLEVVIWSAPLAIIIALGAITWVTTHTLDPYRPLARVSSSKALPDNVKPLSVEVVALDWKWLFIYPEQGIATINELAAPVDRPISFKITASDVMNSFFIPALAGQIYAMPGMETPLHAAINKPGVYDGFSANYSGAGFSEMRFKFHGLSDADFDAWVAKVKASGKKLDTATYEKLAKPSRDVPVSYYSGIAPNLYQGIVNMCVGTTNSCRNVSSADKGMNMKMPMPMEHFNGKEHGAMQP
ncbi:MAG: ubiquinol oxidase subunit II [Pararhizobium sp.]